jgi:hypothetical protein
MPAFLSSASTLRPDPPAARSTRRSSRRFLRPQHWEVLIFGADPERCSRGWSGAEPPHLTKWLSQAGT